MTIGDDDDTLLAKAQQFIGDRDILLMTRFGSALYGTSSPESDVDVRVIFLPTAEEILLGQGNLTLDNHKGNFALATEEMDLVCYSLQAFLERLGQFDMAAIEVLFASQDPRFAIKTTSWSNMLFGSRQEIIAQGDKLPCRLARANTPSLIPRDDTSREEREEVLRRLDALPGGAALASCTEDLRDLQERLVVDLLVEGREAACRGQEALEMISSGDKPRGASAFLLFHDKKYDLQWSVDQLRQVLRSTERKNAKSGVAGDVTIDPKKAYQSIRILDQVIELAADEVITFPRHNAPLLKQIRSGQLSPEDLRREFQVLYQTAIEAEKSLPFPLYRNIATVEHIITECYRSAVCGC